MSDQLDLPPQPRAATAEPTDPGRIEPTYVHVERFAPGSPESLAYLHEHGYVVIAGALSPAECGAALDLTWDYLEELGTGIDRHDWTTWGDDRWPTAVHGGILPGHGVGHSAAQWFIRSAPAVKQAFAAIWDDDDLLVSFDGMALWRPWALNEAWRTNRGGSWLHIDQHPITRPGMQCVQGLVTLLPTTPATGGNVLIPGSHKAFETIPQGLSGTARPRAAGGRPLPLPQRRPRCCAARRRSCATWRPATCCSGTRAPSTAAAAAWSRRRRTPP